MTSIDSLPPELLHQIFHWATYDYALSEKLPSWTNYSLYHPNDGEDPWPELSVPMERERTAKALRLTCTRWTTLATEFELYYLMIHDAARLKYYLSRVRKLLQTDGEGGNSVTCPVRIINLVIEDSQRYWTEEDTDMVVSLIRYSSNLEFLVNECYTGGETHAAGPIILQSLAHSCPKLKRLHWKPRRIMKLLLSSWPSILASSSLATSLEVLEIRSSLPAAADAPMLAPTLRLKLPSLHCLQICVDDASLGSAVAKEWQLPSLKHLYVYQTGFDWADNPQVAFSVSSLITTHGQSLASLAINGNAAYHIPLHLLPPTPIQELLYYMGDLKRNTLSVLFTALSTLVLLSTMDSSWALDKAIWIALEKVHILQGYSLPKLEKVVVLADALDKLKEPHPINVRLLDDTKRLWVEPWLQETPRLLNRNDVQLFTPVETDQD